MADELHFLITPSVNMTYCGEDIEDIGKPIRWVTNDLSRVTCQLCLAEAQRMGVTCEEGYGSFAGSNLRP